MAKAHVQKHTPPPYPLAMIVCDAIWRDPTSGKRFLLGCFTVLHARGFPVQHPVMAVHVVLTNGHGTIEVTARLIDEDETRPPIWGTKHSVDFPDPRGTVELDFVLGPVIFPAAGAYRFQLFAGDEFLMERRIFVRQPDEME